jgi:hypothetical protein
VDFVFEDNEIRGLEQNPQTKSRWGQMARSGKKVMQFLSEGRYVANVVDGEVNPYGGKAITDRATLAAWLLRCGTLVRRSLRPSGPSWRGIVGLERLIPCLQNSRRKTKSAFGCSGKSPRSRDHPEA